MKSKLICVFNNQEIFDKVVKNNENIKESEIHSYDNTTENISIPVRYNHFLDEVLSSDVTKDFDSWCVFIHQDFGVMDNIDSVLARLNKDCIYGAAGAKIFEGFFFGRKYNVKKEISFGFKKEIKLIFGKILQGNNDFNFKPKGITAFFQPTVNAVDCCCIIIHSSLINKYNLRFDENLSFHMYAEELCYRAKLDYKIKTKVVQMNCYHLGQGSFDEEYIKSVQYLKDKFKIKQIPSTCPN